MIPTTTMISTRVKPRCRPGGWSELLHHGPPIEQCLYRATLDTLTYSIITAYVSSPSLGCDAAWPLLLLRMVTAGSTADRRGEPNGASRPRGTRLPRTSSPPCSRTIFDAIGRPSPRPPALRGETNGRARRTRAESRDRRRRRDDDAVSARRAATPTWPRSPAASRALRTRFSNARSSSSSSPASRRPGRRARRSAPGRRRSRAATRAQHAATSKGATRSVSRLTKSMKRRTTVSSVSHSSRMLRAPPRPRRAARRLLEQARVAQDGAQAVAHLVRHARGQLARAGHRLQVAHRSSIRRRSAWCRCASRLALVAQPLHRLS